MKNRILSVLIVITVLTGCNSRDSASNETQSTTPADTEKESDTTDSTDEISAAATYARGGVDDEAAEWITGLLTTDFLKDDLQYLEDRDRKFQLFKADLNDDGEEEYFVRFMSPWFCGSGGCTFYLLSHEGEMITTFTVTTAPIYVERQKKNGWSILLVRDRGVLRELVYENGTYPPNPTVLDEAAYDAPSGNALVMFGEEFGKAKTYSF